MSSFFRLGLFLIFRFFFFPTADGKQTGKQIFEASRDDDKAARHLLNQLIADENVDESLFK